VILVEGGYVVTQERVYREGAVAIEGERIVDVGDASDVKRRVGRGFEKIDARGKLVIPGLVNAHTHIAMTLLRGYADDYPLQEWLERKIWPVEARMRPEDYELGAMLGAVESIRMGVTTVCSLYHYHPEHNEASGILKVGLRGVIGVAAFAWRPEESIRDIRDALERWHGRDGLIRIAVGPHAPYTVDPELWRRLHDLRRWADERYSGRGGRVIITTHVAEDPNEARITSERFNVEIRGGMFEYLDGLGVLDECFLAAHAIHLTDGDIRVIRERGVKIAHCPVSNMKLGMGIARVRRLLDAGITVGLGTDGPASNNTLDLLETAKVASLLQKAITGDPTAIPAREAFRMATIYGARVLLYDDLGDIRPGYLADIVIIDLKRPHLTPIYDPLSHLIYSVRSLDVETVIIGGRVVYREGEFLTVDLDELYERVGRAVERLTAEAS